MDHQFDQQQTGDPQAVVGTATNGGPALMSIGKSADARSCLRVDSRAEFLAMVLHELRNPLNAIQLATEVLRRVEGKSPPPDRIWAGIERAVGSMQSLTDDLMHLCSASHPTFRLCTQPLDLAATAHAAIERRRCDFERNGLWLALEPRPKSVRVSADAARLELVLGNLLDNAQKYTEPGGQVIVSLAAENQEAVLRVQDSGVGIAADVLPYVFEPFVRERFFTQRAAPGSGIGLLLVRTLVELHGGRVEAASGGRGQGTTFTVRLPILAGTT